MTEHHAPAPDAPAPDAGATAPPPPHSSRFHRVRERLGAVSKGAVVALVAGLVVGALSGFALGAAATSDGDRDRDRPGHHGRPWGDDDRRPAPSDRRDGSVPSLPEDTPTPATPSTPAATPSDT